SPAVVGSKKNKIVPRPQPRRPSHACGVAISGGRPCAGRAVGSLPFPVLVRTRLRSGSYPLSTFRGARGDGEERAIAREHLTNRWCRGRSSPVRSARFSGRVAGPAHEGNGSEVIP